MLPVQVRQLDVRIDTPPHDSLEPSNMGFFPINAPEERCWVAPGQLTEGNTNTGILSNTQDAGQP